MRVPGVTPPPALSLSTLLLTLLLQSHPMTFPHTQTSLFRISLLDTRIHSGLWKNNTIHTALGDDDPSTAFHHVLIAFSNFILGGKKHSESYIFPLISSTSCPWSISRTKEAPLPLSTLPGSCNTHTTHTTPPFTKQTVPWNWGFNLHFSVCLYCKKNVLSF